MMQLNHISFLVCGGTLHADSGFILSPNFPNFYSKDIECNWVIVTKVGNIVQLRFEDFQLESSPSCEHDSLTIFEKDLTVVDKICGEVQRNVVIKSKDNEMHLN